MSNVALRMPVCLPAVAPLHQAPIRCSTAYRPSTLQTLRQALKAWQWRAAHCCARRPWRMRVPWRSSSPAVTFAAQRTAGSDGSVSMNDGAGEAEPSTPRQGGRLAAMRRQLQSLGLAGVLAYGMLNTLYYTTAFLSIWVWVLGAPRGLGPAGAVRKVAEAAALTWAGSQVTKLARAAGAVALAPFVDRLLVAIQGYLPVKSRRAAASALVVACLVLAALVYGAVILTCM